MAKSVFQPIYEDLLSRIQDGRLLPGMPLPSENALAVQYGTSRPTIRRAIGLLVEKSLVIRQPGIGSIVTSQPRSNKERKLKIGIDWNPSESFHNTAFYSDKLLSGILAAAEPHGHTVKFLPRTHRELYAKELDGIILTSILPTSEEESSYVALAKQGIPVVLLNRFPVSKELSFRKTASGDIRRCPADCALRSRRISPDAVFRKSCRMAGRPQGKRDSGGPGTDCEKQSAGKHGKVHSCIEEQSAGCHFYSAWEQYAQPDAGDFLIAYPDSGGAVAVLFRRYCRTWRDHEDSFLFHQDAVEADGGTGGELY